jgi:CrcB protein
VVLESGRAWPDEAAYLDRIGQCTWGHASLWLDSLALGLDLGALLLSTLLINLSGSLLVGYLAGLWATGGAATPHPYKWHFWVTGLCGGYTTFSAFSWQVIHLVREGEGTLAGAYAAGSIAMGIFAVWLGLSLAMRGRTAG